MLTCQITTRLISIRYTSYEIWWGSLYETPIAIIATKTKNKRGKTLTSINLVSAGFYLSHKQADLVSLCNQWQSEGGFGAVKNNTSNLPPLCHLLCSPEKQAGRKLIIWHKVIFHKCKVMYMKQKTMNIG